ncbi:NAD(P)-dependent alcohol dehydrogenase [Candidatus Bathyarchaeota archaeon]|nr:NAD(P)-dependent alcohol dehydrogenase [Candidatus Bathyarchaeota archaeon]
MVLGHEGVGVVEKVGPAVSTLKKGDRVGLGYQRDACGNCHECISGQEVYCLKRAVYGAANLDQGTFGSYAIWREPFAHPIPEGMSDEVAAPLQCAGATVFSALKDTSASDTVAIQGVGGLGHLAIQFAAKKGCRVVVLSGSDRKREQAMQLGAHKFIAMNKGEGKELARDEAWLIDRLIVTAAAPPDWKVILPMLAPRASIFPLSVSFDNIDIPYLPVILWGIRVQGSLVATRAVHREMLAFAALHGIKPITEKFPMTEKGIVEAMDKLDKGQVNYRAVLMSQ